MLCTAVSTLTLCLCHYYLVCVLQLTYYIYMSSSETAQLLNVKVDNRMETSLNRTFAPTNATINHYDDANTRFVKLNTVVASVALLVLAVILLIYMYAAPNVAKPVGTAVRVQAHAIMFVISLLYNQYCNVCHQRIRQAGYLQLDRETSYLYYIPSAVYAVGNAIMLICYAIWFEVASAPFYIIPALEINTVEAITTLETIVTVTVLLYYIRRVTAFNNSQPPPDLYNAMYNAHSDRGQSQALLDEQGDMIEYLRNKTETLMKQVQEQQKRLRQYEGMSSKDYFEPALVSNALDIDAEDDLLRHSNNVDDLRRAIHNKRKTVNQLEAETRSLVEAKNDLIRSNRDLKLDLESLQQQVTVLKAENRQYRTSAVEYEDEKKRMTSKLEAQREAEAKALKQAGIVYVIILLIIAELRRQLSEKQ